MNIPSNFTIEEIIKYTTFPPEVEDKLYQVLKELNDRHKEIERLRRDNEILSEQLYFRNVFIEQVQQACKETTKHKDLVKYFNDTLENSYIEL